MFLYFLSLSYLDIYEQINMFIFKTLKIKDPWLFCIYVYVPYIQSLG